MTWTRKPPPESWDSSWFCWRENERREPHLATCWRGLSEQVKVAILFGPGGGQWSPWYGERWSERIKMPPKGKQR